MTKPNRKQHAKILGAYLNRLPLKQLEEIVQAQRNAWHATLNLSNWSQDRAQNHANEVIETAIRHITDYDLALIESAITTEEAPHAH